MHHLAMGLKYYNHIANRQFIVHIHSIESIHPYFKGKLKFRLKPVPSVTDEVIISQEKPSWFKDWVAW